MREGATPPAGMRTAEPGGSGCENVMNWNSSYFSINALLKQIKKKTLPPVAMRG